MESPPSAPVRTPRTPHGNSSKNHSSDQHRSGEKLRLKGTPIAAIPFKLPDPTLPPPLEVFDMFPEFPVEVRHTIWEIHLDGLAPRYVPFSALLTHYQSTGKSPDGEIPKPSGVLWDAVSARVRLPDAFYICKESREVASKKLAFQYGFKGRPVYFNPKIDTLLLGQDYSVAFRNYLASVHKSKSTIGKLLLCREIKEIRANVQRVAFTHVNNTNFVSIIRGLPRWFPNAKTAVLAESYTIYHAAFPDMYVDGLPEDWAQRNGKLPMPKLEFVSLIDVDDPEQDTGLYSHHVEGKLRITEYYPSVSAWIGMGEKKVFDHQKGVLEFGEHIGKNAILPNRGYEGADRVKFKDDPTQWKCGCLLRSVDLWKTGEIIREFAHQDQVEHDLWEERKNLAWAKARRLGVKPKAFTYPFYDGVKYRPRKEGESDEDKQWYEIGSTKWYDSDMSSASDYESASSSCESSSEEGSEVEESSEEDDDSSEEEENSSNQEESQSERDEADSEDKQSLGEEEADSGDEADSEEKENSSGEEEASSGGEELDSEEEDD